MASFQKILVAVDRSPASDLVFDRALALAQSNRAAMVLLSAISPDYGIAYLNPPIYPGGEAMTISEPAMRAYMERQEQERADGVAFLNSLAQRASTVSVTAEISPQIGEPGRTICEVAKSQAVDLIIVGRRGHSGFNELLMGSVSNYVLHHAPCSVLIVQG
jgi:nucleotide-binding universal stress UspA family protein